VTLIIGASGRARHGKTISCDAILAHARIAHGLHAKLYDIGSYVRQFAVDNGLLPDVPRASMTKEQLAIMVQVGNQQRAIDENFWVRQMMDGIDLDKPDVACIPNLRFPQEGFAIKGRGGYVVRFTRLNADGSIYISPDRDPNDPTETALEFWPADFYLTAKQDHEDLLIMEAITLYEYLRRKHVN